ncbi:MAG: insulinase family protein [Acidobacteria bacterium]|uniref:Insulinase family protein n=1 Tax=Candidatus Polarisedimenticola svalbardensis TaxID=2886004 RepID=A0A8J7CC45_9BACT|nr:insulinase family protein [Candidatus Polarisedimenticola svalbardensis]
MKYHRVFQALAAAIVLAASLSFPSAIEVQVETYTLPNGLTVTLYEDHSLPRVTINTWFAVGSKDEDQGRSGFAHMFEHLMFMGTHRVPDNQFDVLMETGGGANNASTSTDRTNYYSWGPPELLPTLLWLDADRLADLADAMTVEKLDLQRNVVRNERRQGVENTPYGIAEEILAPALYPKGHPYWHTVIGSHEDLEAATLDDVKNFFNTHYVPGNASLVVAGDFDPDQVKQVIASSFGAVPARPIPSPIQVPAVSLEREVRRVAVDNVQYPRLYLVWHSPASFRDGDAEMDLIAEILAGGESSRLYKKLVVDLRLAQDVTSYQYSKELGSQFHVEVTAVPGADLQRIKAETLAVIEDLKEQGPSDIELKRVTAATESAFLQRMESLSGKADSINRYRHYLGVADGFQWDLDRYLTASPAGIRSWAGKVFGDGRVDLRILPRDATVAGADLDNRPALFAAGGFTPPRPETFRLSNGLTVHALSRPGSGLFAAELLSDGGEYVIPAEKAGLSALTGTLLTAGAAGRNAGEFADAVALLGAQINATSSGATVSVSVNGIGSRMEETLDLFADAVLRPNLEQADFDREKQLQLAGIKARADDPVTLAGLASRKILFGSDDPRGRPTAGYAATVGSLTVTDVKETLPTLLNPRDGQLLVVGDFATEALKKSLEKRFGKWRAPKGDRPDGLPPLVDPAPGRIVLLDRPDAPQTVVYILRPVPPLSSDDPVGRGVRESLNILFGGSFTSRLNQNLREKHGYTYGAFSRFLQEKEQYMLFSASRVQTAVTGPALTEYRNEFNRLAGGDISADELTKAVKTARQDVVDSAGTTGSLLALFSGLAADGRPMDDSAVYLESLAKVDLDRANREARSGFYDWSRLLVILVGDREAVVSQLKEAGFPEPVIYSVDELM